MKNYYFKNKSKGYNFVVMAEDILDAVNEVKRFVEGDNFVSYHSVSPRSVSIVLSSDLLTVVVKDDNGEQLSSLSFTIIAKGVNETIVIYRD